MLQCPKCGRHYTADVTTCPEDGTPLRADATVAVRLPLDPLLGHALDGKYRLDARLGEGGMGTVYRATHLLIERPVAVKVLNSRLVTDEEAKERFRREARAAGRLRHPNAVAVTDFGETSDGLVYIVMELLEGTSLREVLEREAPLGEARAVTVMSQVASAVAAAHAAGVIHRDLKPANIFLVEREGAPPVVKVLDFGIAKLAADAHEDGEARDLTQTGIMIGTPRYMSPEQCDGARLTPASDVYSLGIILYEMLTGQTPFNGTSPLAVALQHSAKSPRRPSEVAPGLSPALERVVLHTLEKRPSDRPADAEEFRRELLSASETVEAERAEAVEAERAARAGSTGRAADGDGEQKVWDALLFDVEAMRERRAEQGDTTLLAPRSARAGAASHDTGRSSRVTSQIEREGPQTVREAAPARPEHSRIRVRFRPSGSWLRRPVALLLVGALLAMLASGLFAFVNRFGGAGVTTVAEATPTPQPTPAPTPQPTPSPEPTPTPTPAARRNAQANRRPRRTNAQPRKESFLKRTIRKINPF